MTPFVFNSKRYPITPGCYLMKDGGGKVLYVGKAKNLRKRLCSYFQHNHKEWRIHNLVERIRDIEVILVNTEIESLILENNLIKCYRPRYNRALMRDEQGYPYIVLTNEPFPRFVPYKKHRVNWALDGLDSSAVQRRFGPYPSNRFRNTLLEFVNETFLLRSCNPMPKRACLLHHFGRCSAPCEGFVSREDYALAVKRATQFLARPPVGVVRQVRARMMMHADRMEFERAGRIKHQLQVLERALSFQIVERDVKHDQDVIDFGERTAMIMRIRCGAVEGMELLKLGALQGGDAEDAALCSRYASSCPDELIVNRLRNGRQAAETLRRSTGVRVKVTVPRHGVALALLKLCRLNHDYRMADSAAASASVSA